MLKPRTAKTAAIGDGDRRRLDAAYRRELRASIRSAVPCFAAIELGLGFILLALGNVHIVAVAAAIAIGVSAFALLRPLLVQKSSRRHPAEIAMAFGLLPIVPGLVDSLLGGNIAFHIGLMSMIPLVFPLFVPLEPRGHLAWLLAFDLIVFGSVAAYGAGSPLLANLPVFAALLLASTAFSVMASRPIQTRRSQLQREMLATRALYASMREREIDLRRQDEFLLMQQETLVVQQDELLRLNQELETIARLDGLTGLGNRLRLNEDLAQLAGRLERGGGSAGLLLLDLDRFKRLNDSAGHLAGDAALKGVADVLRKTARVGDGLYRYGGEEFLVVLHDADEQTLSLAGQRYVSAIEAAAMPHPDSPPWNVVTASAGAAELSRRTGLDVDAALRAADEALYEAKARGRNRLEIHRSRTGERVIVDIDQRRAAS